VSPRESADGLRRIVFLLGFMGAGKSFLSHRISELGGIPRYDLDEEIERTQGMTIDELFEVHGEAAFRTLERAELERLCAGVRRVAEGRDTDSGGLLAVVSTGGGTPCFGDNMEWMKGNGLTVWVNTPKDVLLERLKRGRAHRPLIKGLDDKGLESFVDALLEARSPYYSKSHLEWRVGVDDTMELMKLLEHA
jgi:shikimate kinase